MRENFTQGSVRGEPGDRLSYRDENQGLPVWVDSRNLRGGDQLAPEIRQAIADAPYVLVVFSLRTINSIWVRQEIKYALDLKKR